MLAYSPIKTRVRRNSIGQGLALTLAALALIATVVFAAPAQADAAGECAGHALTVEFSKGESPTSGADVIWATNGDDSITLTAGDILCSGQGVDTIRGDATGSLIYAGAGVDDIRVTTTAGQLGVTVYAGDGRDFIKTGNGNDILHGGPGSDTIQAGNGNDSIAGGLGNDAINAQGGDDVVNGHDGHDYIWGWTGSDSLDGGDGNDTIDGGDGNDFLMGGPGDDTVLAGSGFDKIYYLTRGTLPIPQGPPSKELLNTDMVVPDGATGIGNMEEEGFGWNDTVTAERWVDIIVPEEYWGEKHHWDGGRWA